MVDARGDRLVPALGFDVGARLERIVVLCAQLGARVFTRDLEFSFGAEGAENCVWEVEGHFGLGLAVEVLLWVSGGDSVDTKEGTNVEVFEFVQVLAGRDNVVRLTVAAHDLSLSHKGALDKRRGA